MLTGPRRLPLLALGLAAAAFAVGCSKEKQFDVAGAKSEIQRELSGRFGVKAESLKCPEDVPAGRGESFTCTGEDRKGRSFTLDVKLLNARGSFRYTKPAFENG